MTSFQARVAQLLLVVSAFLTQGCTLDMGPKDFQVCGPINAAGYSICMWLLEEPTALTGEERLQLDGEVKPADASKKAGWQEPLGKCVQEHSISTQDGQHLLCNLSVLNDGDKVILAPARVSKPSASGETKETFLCDAENCPETIVFYFNGHQTRLGQDNPRFSLVPHDGIPGNRLDIAIVVDTKLDAEETVEPVN